MREVDVSVVVPTHRREKLVVRAVESALRQQNARVEVIVLDDTAEGTARQGVEAIADARVRYVKREIPSRGKPSLVRNEGAFLAAAPYVHFLDDDDELFDDALAALAQPLEGTTVGMSFGVVHAQGEDQAAVERERRYFALSAASARRCGGSRRRMALEILFGTVPLITSACLVRREVMRDLGGFDVSMGLCEDNEFFLRASRTYGATFVDRPVLRHFTGHASLSQDARPQAWNDAYATIHRNYRRRFGAAEFYALKAWSLFERFAPRRRYGTA